MKFLYTFLFLFLFYCAKALSQDSLWQKQENDVIVTATRINISKKISATPVFVITKKQIQQIGAVKLNDVLQEQIGMNITNGSGSRAVGGGVFGNGIQMQGLSPDHVLLLIDGEPVIGRQGGTIDLTRIAVGNIKQIEIIKGPFSSLYGSEAMGGVINIITENPLYNTFNTSIRYGSFNTSDIQAKGFLKSKKIQTLLFANLYSTNGYDLNKNDIEKTADANNSFATQAKVEYKLNDKYNLSTNARLLLVNQQSNYAINSNEINIAGYANTTDIANTVKLENNTNNIRKNTTTFTLNKYIYNQLLDSVKNNSRYYSDNFQQNFSRIEHIEALKIGTNKTLQLGLGYTNQSIKTDRYNGKQTQNAWHSYAQYDVGFKNIPLLVSTGLRYDYNSAFKASVNPKFALSYRFKRNWKLSALLGSGFKAPDFRQLYLNFINNAGDNYIIYGTQEFSLALLQQQLNSGFIAQILPTAYQIKKLLPEQSVGYSVNINGAIINNVIFETNVFYNNVKNLIQYVEIAKRSNGAAVYSYANIQNAFTTGIETALQWQVNKYLNFSTSYQFLKSGDKEIIKNLQNNKIYGRDAVGTSARLLSKKEYKNLQNRSTHTAQFKVNYTYKQFNTSIRVLYKSKWGVNDYDGNAFANMDAEFAKSYLLLNWSISNQFNKNYNTVIGINNLTNYKDAINVTNLMPRNFFITIQYQLNKHKKTEK